MQPIIIIVIIIIIIIISLCNTIFVLFYQRYRALADGCVPSDPPAGQQ